MNETKGEYGEPWKYDPGSADDEDTIRDRDGGCVIECGPGDMMIEDIERIVACVNALSGIRNPAAVQALVEAVRKYAREVPISADGWGFTWALAALDREPEVGK